MRRLTFAVLWAVATLAGGCMVASCDSEPFAMIPVAAIGVPAAGPPAPAIAACTQLIAYDGRDYNLTSPEAWRVPVDSLTEIGTASGANPAAGDIADRRVYALDGVKPDDAIAMRIGLAGDLTVLVRVGLDTPKEVCRYLVAGVRWEGCAESDQ
ncbi:MAG: hypothetical protein ABR593_01110 [Candidatus Limnocylindria bacterium]